MATTTIPSPLDLAASAKERAEAAEAATQQLAKASARMARQDRRARLAEEEGNLKLARTLRRSR